MTPSRGPVASVGARTRSLIGMLMLVAGCAPSLQILPPPSPGEIARLEAEAAASPEDPEALVALGRAYRAAGRAAEARPVLEKALSIAPGHEMGTLMLGIVHEDLEQFADAGSHYRRYLEISDSPWTKDAVRRRMALLERRMLRASIRAALANETTLAGDPSNGSYVAVFPFTYAGSNPDLVPLSRALAELLATDLGQTDRITILERARIQILLDELDLAASGAVDPATAARGGQLLGAGRIIQGQVDGSEDLIRLQAAIVDVQDLEVANPVVEQDALQQLFDLEKRLALSLYTSLGVELTPAERERISRRPTQSLQALLQFGMGLLAEDQGDYGTAARHYEGAARIDPAFQGARDRMAETGTLAASAAISTAELSALAESEMMGPLAGLNEMQRMVPSDMSGRDASSEVLGNEGLGREAILEIIIPLPDE